MPPSCGKFFMGMFWDLSTERQVGATQGQIPWSAAMRYFGYRGLDKQAADMCWMVIHRMDTRFLDWHDREQERRRQQAAANK